MKELDKNKEYITSNLSEERRKELIEYLIEEDLEWEILNVEELLDCVLICKEDGWHADYEKYASQDAIDANTLFEEIKLDKNVSYYLGDLSLEQLEEVRLVVIKENHAMVFMDHIIYSDSKYLEWGLRIWTLSDSPKNEEVNALALFDISDKKGVNVLNNGFKLPPFWCLKITEENKDKVEQWLKSHKDYRGQHEVKGYLLSEPYYDFSYQSWTDDRPDNFEEITMEQFLQFVYAPWVEKETVVSIECDEKLDDVKELLEEKQGTGMKDLPQLSDYNIPSDYYLFNHKVEELYDFLQKGSTQLEEFNKDTSFGAGEKQQFFFYNSKTHGPNFYTKEEVQFHNGEEWSEDIVVYTQLGSNKKFATTKERFKKFKEVWI